MVVESFSPFIADVEEMTICIGYYFKIQNCIHH